LRGAGARPQRERTGAGDGCDGREHGAHPAGRTYDPGVTGPERGRTVAVPADRDYGFLSNCHTGALVSPDGGIGWLCVPRFDSPSVCGTLLDRQAGYFRLGPFGIHHPTARVYEPGTNILATTWKTPNGWVLVRDALTMGARDSEDAVTPHTRPPADDDAERRDHSSSARSGSSPRWRSSVSSSGPGT
jgi:GH15 family glucan-1,4-alpha-glucosidase